MALRVLSVTAAVSPALRVLSALCVLTAAFSSVSQATVTGLHQIESCADRCPLQVLYSTERDGDTPGDTAAGRTSEPRITSVVRKA